MKQQHHQKHYSVNGFQPKWRTLHSFFFVDEDLIYTVTVGQKEKGKGRWNGRGRKKGGAGKRERRKIGEEVYEREEELILFRKIMLYITYLNLELSFLCGCKTYFVKKMVWDNVWHRNALYGVMPCNGILVQVPLWQLTFYVSNCIYCTQRMLTLCGWIHRK